MNPTSRTLLTLALTAAMVSLSPRVACATDIPKTIEAGLSLGYHWLDDNNQLGDAYYDDNILGSSVAIGLRGGYNLTRELGAELELTFLPSSLRRQDNLGQRSSFAPALGLRVSGLWHFNLMEDKLRAFGLVGVGNEMLLKARDFRKVDQHDYTEKDADIAFSIGGGAKYQLLPFLLLRADLRYSGTAGRNPAGSLSHGLAFHIGASYLLGAKMADKDGDGIADGDDKCPDKAEDKDGFEDLDGCPDPDNDKDGIPDDKDKCPDQAENKNGVADTDGCPDGDRDGDGVADAADKCPDKAEDKDGFEDQDGCPEFDNDKDGMADNRDKCPNEAEDMDGFEDLDGCPDLDNDKDGVPDKQDKCPNQPETRNGYQDQDGCPDEVPKVLTQAFSGPIAGVDFDKGTANLDTRSYKALDKLLALLKEHATVRIRVTAHVHASDSPEADAQLTAKRAEVVGAYFVNRGVSTDRVVTEGRSGKEPLVGGTGKSAARKNERVEIRLLGE